MNHAPSYDAFISYSHALDRKLAPALQYGVERFAKPWYQVRALRLFRDDAVLTASPALWPSIEAALADAKWFVLMASPVAAASRWVDREVRWWLENQSVDRMLIVVTDGDLVWDAQAGDVDWTASTALPESLCGAFQEEPRWVDLRELRSVEHVEQANPVLRNAVADVAAAVRGVPKDQLVGEHLRQHRRTMLLARSAVTALVILLVLAVIGGLVALAQRSQARNEARIATARQIAATAVANLNTHLNLAQLLAVEAYRMNPDPLTRSALFQVVAASPRLTRYLSAGARVTTVIGSADGNTVIAGTADGHVQRWDLGHDVHTTLRISSAPITSVATDTHGTKIFAADGATATLWDTTNGRYTALHSGRSALVAVSPSGYRLAVLDELAAYTSGPGSGTLIVYDGHSGQQLNRTTVDNTPWTKLGLPDDTTVMLVDSAGAWERHSIPNHLLVAAMIGDKVSLSPVNSFIEGYSPNGEYYGYNHQYSGEVDIWHIAAASTDTTKWDNPDLRTTSAAEQAEAFTISADGTRVATAVAGVIYVVPTASNQQSARREQLTGNSGIRDLAFAGDERLVSASEDTVTLWDLASPGRFGMDLGVPLASDCHACEPQLAASPDGRRVAFVTTNQATEYRLDGPANPQVLAGPVDVHLSGFPGAQTLPVWSADGGRLVLLGLSNNSALTWDPRKPSHATGRWPSAIAGTDAVTARVSTDGTQVVEVDSHGDVLVRKFSDGAVERTFPGASDLNTLGFPPPPAAATISYDLATAALVDHPDAVTLVDLRTGTRRVLPGGPAYGVLFTRNRLLVQRNGALQEWDTAGTRLLQSIPGAGADQSVLGAAPQGDLAASLRSDNMVVLTALDAGIIIGSFPLPAPSIGQTVMTFTPDGAQLLVGAEGARLTRWEMTDTAWLRNACDRAGRDLAAAEWRQYVGTMAPTDLRCNR